MNHVNISVKKILPKILHKKGNNIKTYIWNRDRVTIIQLLKSMFLLPMGIVYSRANGLHFTCIDYYLKGHFQVFQISAVT